MFTIISCKGETKKTSHIEEAESIEADDYEILEEDELDFIDAAMDALDSGNSSKAAEKLMSAADQIKTYIGEMDDPKEANIAVARLIELAIKIKSGAKMTSDELQKTLLDLEFFSEDDLEIEDE
jgi:hypothetical protein